VNQTRCAFQKGGKRLGGLLKSFDGAGAQGLLAGQRIEYRFACSGWNEQVHAEG
jgi:hypothetical protein